MGIEANRALVEEFWATLYRRDWEAIAAFFTEDSHYTDVPAPEEGAFGPAEIVARLRLGIEPLEAYIEHRRSLVVTEDMAVTEHGEEWHWSTGERVLLPFVSVMELRDGRILRWWDYWNMGTLMAAAPEWWVTHIMAGYK